MEFKLESGKKIKLKDVSIDERDEMLDSVEYTYDDKGNCLEVNPCYGDYRIDKADQCLTKIEHRAWSSPIFVSNIYNEQ